MRRVGGTRGAEHRGGDVGVELGDVREQVAGALHPAPLVRGTLGRTGAARRPVQRVGRGPPASPRREAGGDQGGAGLLPLPTRCGTPTASTRTGRPCYPKSR